MIEAVVVVGIIAAIVLLMLLSTYNGLMQQRQEVRSAWAQIDEQLKRRYDLVPVLISTVQSQGGTAAAKLPAVSAAKNQAAVAFNPTQLAQAEAALSVAIHDVLATIANDPALSGNSSLIEIRQQLLASEKQIDQARQRYNERVDALNATLASFPQVVTAKVIGLHEQPGFES